MLTLRVAAARATDHVEIALRGVLPSLAAGFKVTQPSETRGRGGLTRNVALSLPESATWP